MIKTALLCLALTIFHESRGEPIEGQYAVAEVVLNRAEKEILKYVKLYIKRGNFKMHINGKFHLMIIVAGKDL